MKVGFSLEKLKLVSGKYFMMLSKLSIIFKHYPRYIPAQNGSKVQRIDQILVLQNITTELAGRRKNILFPL